jgi:trehalose 6-phosphate phosphatase
VRSDLRALARQPGSAGLFTDFDGTLAPIVDDPATAAPVDGALDTLTALARRLGRVGVLSGRPLTYLDEHFPEPLVLAGLYGLEVREDGVRRDHPEAGAWREVVADVVQAADTGPVGMRIESKGLSLTLHYRGQPDLEPAVVAWARDQGVRSGLLVRRAKMSVELHPPIEADKGTTLETLAAGLTTVAFLGDDVGDLPAFDGLDRLAATGLTTIKVAIRGAEQSDELVERAEIVVDGPAGALELLRDLLAQLDGLPAG